MSLNLLRFEKLSDVTYWITLEEFPNVTALAGVALILLGVGLKNMK
ncbi:MAG TPA: hypothetical protein VEW65_10585 [Chryseolinea sp.]|nr:hypothetical protein [Chryseolinea sp.]